MTPRHRKNQIRPGISRLELVVLAVVTYLALSLAMPALARVRQLSSREQSANNLRQIGQGLHAYRTTFGFFPSNGGPPPETVATPDIRTGFPTMEAFRWGYGDPKRAGRLQTGSWAYAILPFVGEEEAFRKQAYDRSVPLYYISARRLAKPQAVPAKDPVYAGWTYMNDGLNPWGRTDYAANDQVVGVGMGRVMKAAQITDGLSETFLVGEKALDLKAMKAGSWYWDEPILLGESGGTARKGKNLYRDADDLLEKVADNWGSPDAAGVQFLFADGRVALLSYKTPEKLMWSMMTPNAGDDVDMDSYLVGE